MQEIQRSLLTVDECLRMPGPVKGQREGRDVIEKAGDMIVYVAGFRRFTAGSHFTFRTPYFRRVPRLPHPSRVTG